ncbi:MAG: YesL family protein [Atopobiaceae bacterium]|nr:YesL family protein [Atopobiaceae bacterium]
MAFFSYESKFSKVMMRFSQGCYLNLLWAICSLPIVTIGASTTALYAVALKIARDEEGDITQQFFSALRSNFVQATQIWLILLAIGAVLGTDIYVLTRLQAATTGTLAIAITIALAMVIVSCIVLAIVLMYVFPLVARVQNTNVAMIKNSFLMGTHYLFCTICVFVIHAAMAFAIIAFFTPLAILGEGVCAILSSYLLNPVIQVSSTDPSRMVTSGDGQS